ncbi:RidA family protein [Maribacter sp. 2307ULW6-5]|uniref:RidA family protein n=1 Tax=Maribacter sp. 2307ULW6-5 TaxID=3386275 RepID=UPI0039BD7182
METQVNDKVVVNPEKLQPAFPGYSHVVVSPPGRTVFISGQTSVDVKGDIVGIDNFELQFKKAVENLDIALRASGATFKDVTKLNYYIVNYNPDQLPAIMATLSEYVSKDVPPAATMVSVAGLYLHELLVEIEAIAVIND